MIVDSGNRGEGGTWITWITSPVEECICVQESYDYIRAEILRLEGQDDAV
jgi:hypothetical protein